MGLPDGNDGQCIYLYIYISWIVHCYSHGWLMVIMSC